MRNTAFVISVLLIIAIQINIIAQDSLTNHVGIGISVDPARIGHVTYISNGEVTTNIMTIDNQSPILLYIPLNLSDQLRIEPFFGINKINNEQNQELITPNPNYNLNSSSYENKVITMGLGVYRLFILSKTFGLYLGPKINWDLISYTTGYGSKGNYNGNYTSSNNVTNTKEVDITIGLDFGAEYFPFSQFSIGADASFNYTSFGNPDVTNTYTSIPPNNYPPSNISNKITQYSFNTRGIFFARWYFL